MALRPPKRPSPPTTRPYLSLKPVRGRESVDLDDRKIRISRDEPLQDAPPYVGWRRFYDWFDGHWEIGPPDWPNSHLVIVGQAGSGKTTLAQDLLEIPPYVVVMGTKAKDDSLYLPLQRRGFEVTDKFDPTDSSKPRVIFRPRLDTPTREAVEYQRAQFQRALWGIFSAGGWCIYLDEVRYLSETLKLTTELDMLWLQGRSLGVTMVSSTQRPVSVPRNAFEQAAHFILFRISGKEDRARASEYTGTHAPVVAETVARLPRHEFLYIDSVEDVLVRSKKDK